MNEEVQKDLHLVYTTSVGDIKFAKLQQWRITYYALVLMIGIFYLIKHYSLHLTWIFVLQLVIPILALSAVSFLIKIENDIFKYRSKMVQTGERLSNEFKKINPVDENYLKRKRVNIINTIWKFSILIPLYKTEYLHIQMGTISIVGFLLLLIAITTS